VGLGCKANGDMGRHHMADKEGPLCFLDMLQQDQFIPRPFNGLFDRNGKGIYEGNVLEAQDDDESFYSKSPATRNRQGIGLSMKRTMGIVTQQKSSIEMRFLSSATSARTWSCCRTIIKSESVRG
jgi:hypothetical protein